MRISKDECFLEITKVIRKRSTCKRRQYASLIVKYTNEGKQGFILSSGYNGQASGLPNCSDRMENCKRIQNNVPHGKNYSQSDCNSIHSEMNACLQAGRWQIDKDCILYLSGFDLITNTEIDDPTPCKLCEGVMRNMGIVKYINNTGEHFLNRRGMSVEAG
jgi:dCMP deaminase